jgi:hypothetical protein
VANIPNPRSPMNINSYVAFGSYKGFSGVNPHPYSDLAFTWPIIFRQSPLNFNCCAYCFSGPGE